MKKFNSKMVFVGVLLLAFSIIAPLLATFFLSDILYLLGDYSLSYLVGNIWPVLGFVLIVCGVRGQDRVTALVAVGLVGLRIFIFAVSFAVFIALGCWPMDLFEFSWVFDLLILISTAGLCYLAYTKRQYDGNLKYLTYAFMVLLAILTLFTMSINWYGLFLIPLVALYYERVLWLIFAVNISLVTIYSLIGKYLPIDLIGDDMLIVLMVLWVFVNILALVVIGVRVFIRKEKMVEDYEA